MPPLETIIFIFGCLLILLSITGGGFEIKELKIPKISKINRFISVLLGLIFALYPLISSKIFGVPSEKIVQEIKDGNPLQKAYDLAGGGDLTGAIRLAGTISPSSDQYQKAKTKVAEWQQTLTQQSGKSDRENLQKAYDLAAQGDFDGAIQLAKTIPSSSDQYQKAKTKVAEWQQTLTQQSGKSDRENLQKAYDLAAHGDFDGAIQLAKTIPSSSDQYQKAKTKVAEWQQTLTQQSGKSDQENLQKAYDLAAQGDLDGAIQLAKTIPPSSDKYQKAKTKVAEWKKLAKAKNN